MGDLGRILSRGKTPRMEGRVDTRRGRAVEMTKITIMDYDGGQARQAERGGERQKASGCGAAVPFGSSRKNRQPESGGG